MAGNQWKRIVTAGMIGGIAFMVVELGLLAAFNENAFIVLRMTAAIVLGRDVLPPPAGFDAGIALTALVVHFALAILFTAIYARLIARWTEAVLTAVVCGALYGLAVHAWNYYVTVMAFPWFMDGRSWMNMLAHLVFGVVIAMALRPHDSRFAL